MEESKFDLIKYKNSYNSEKYDRITIMPPKGSREVYQRAAAQAGESVTKYIINAINDRLRRDGIID